MAIETKNGIQLTTRLSSSLARFGEKATPYAAHLTKALEIDARRPKRDRRSALKLFGELKMAGFDGDYNRVTEFVRNWRLKGGQAMVKAFVPLHFELGEAFQFDWSEEHLLIGGVWRKIMASHLKLCASRAFVVQAYPCQAAQPFPPALLCVAPAPRRGRGLKLESVYLYPQPYQQKLWTEKSRPEAAFLLPLNY